MNRVTNLTQLTRAARLSLQTLPAEDRPDADEHALDQEEDGGAQRGRQRVHARLLPLLALLVVDAAAGRGAAAPAAGDDDVSSAGGLDAGEEGGVATAAVVVSVVAAAELELVADVDHARDHQLSKRRSSDVIM